MISMTVVGNIGGELKLATVGQSGREVLNFSVASNHGKGDQKSTTWVRCALFGPRANAVKPLLKSGGRVVVSGSAKLREWQGNGGTKTDLEIEVEGLEIIDYADDGQRPAPGAQAAAQAAAPAPGPALPPGVPAGSALHHANGNAQPPTHYCVPGGTAWTPIPVMQAPAPALPPPPAAQPRAAAPF